jgi:hypothetical protein
LSTIPPEYHEFADVFSKKEADKLPEHRPYDHTIPLQDGATPPFGGVYNLSETELTVLRKYLDDNIRKGYIKSSQSPCGAPVLFVRKSDGSLRLLREANQSAPSITKNDTSLGGPCATK